MATEGELFAAGLADSIGEYIDHAIAMTRERDANIVLESAEYDTIEVIAERIRAGKVPDVEAAVLRNAAAK